MSVKKREILSYNKSSQEYIEDRYVGKKFNRLTIIGIIGYSSINKTPIAKALCDCGNVATPAAHDIRRGHTKSCGCARIDSNKAKGIGNLLHGEGAVWKRTNEYRAWLNIKETLKKMVEGKGVCDRWREPRKGYINFLEDMGRKPAACILKRIDKNKEYCKDNCKWKRIRGKNANKLSA